jgi:hypothetical protein
MKRMRNQPLFELSVVKLTSNLFIPNIGICSQAAYTHAATSYDFNSAFLKNLPGEILPILCGTYIYADSHCSSRISLIFLKEDPILFPPFIEKSLYSHFPWCL